MRKLGERILNWLAALWGKTPVGKADNESGMPGMIFILLVVLVCAPFYWAWRAITWPLQQLKKLL
jgi:hypothetical protein